MNVDFSTQADFSQLNPAIDWQKEILFFWEEWNNEKDFIIVNTSGSTGTPKPIKISKRAISASAELTCKYFDLQKGQTALLCLPVQYIAGKMMLIRAQSAGLNVFLMEPQLKIKLQRPIDFCAMTPAQCQESLEFIPHIKTLILGGSSVSSTLEKSLEKLPTEVYETYGMTETLSHIALRNIKKEQFFNTLEGINIKKSETDCLQIHAPHIQEEWIDTHDVVEILDNGNFYIKGRKDNIINSGGIKIQPEILEKEVYEKTGAQALFFGEQDEKWGESLAVIVEGKTDLGIESFIKWGWKKIHHPKKIYTIDSFCRSQNGKTLRKETIKKIKK